MSVQSVREFFKSNNLDYKIYELEESTATVELAAKAHNVEPAMIAKSMALRLKERYIIIVTAGDAKLDNKKFKDEFKEKIQFLKGDEVPEITGHPVGGVCPFGLKENFDVYLGESLKRFDFVFPAAGSANTSIKIAPDNLKEITNAAWISVSK